MFQLHCEILIVTKEKLSAEELMLLNCGVGEDSCESLGLQGRSNQSILKETSPGCSLERLMLRLPILWPPDVKSWLIGKVPDAGRHWGQKEKGTTEDEMAGWHHQPDAHEFGWTLGVGDGQGGLACCDLWGRKESDTTEQLNWTEIYPKRNVEIKESWHTTKESHQTTMREAKIRWNDQRRTTNTIGEKKKKKRKWPFMQTHILSGENMRAFPLNSGTN